MTKTFKLPRLNQCEKCPWKKSTNPKEIPDGYTIENHIDLKKTISSGIESINNLTHVMACHHTNGKDEMYCIGWLNNQLGVGNNLGLRIQMMKCENIGQIKVFGEQHKTFEDTIPSISHNLSDTEKESFNFAGKKKYKLDIKISK